MRKAMQSVGLQVIFKGQDKDLLFFCEALPRVSKPINVLKKPQLVE
jgi:hypothetical protein